MGMLTPHSQLRALRAGHLRATRPIMVNLPRKFHRLIHNPLTLGFQGRLDRGVSAPRQLGEAHPKKRTILSGWEFVNEPHVTMRVNLGTTFSPPCLAYRVPRSSRRLVARHNSGFVGERMTLDTSPHLHHPWFSWSEVESRRGSEDPPRRILSLDPYRECDEQQQPELVYLLLHEERIITKSNIDHEKCCLQAFRDFELMPCPQGS